MAHFDRFATAQAGTGSAGAASPDLPVYTVDRIADYITHSYAGNGSAVRFADPVISVNLSGLTADGQTLARAALAAWHDVLDVSFNETTGSAQITFDDTQAGAVTSSLSNGGYLKYSSVNIGTDWLTRYGTSLDGYAFQSFLHETGHALGLGHAGPYDGAASYGADAIYANDTWQYSVMSYFDQTNYGASYRFVSTVQMADIVAGQSLYGAATETRSGATVYGFKSTAGALYDFAAYGTTPAFTIYDSGGSDTLSASGYTMAQKIDLNAGHFSDIGGLVGNIAIAVGVVIEKATGGRGTDTLIGNSGANTLNGGAGADIMIGGAGNDIYSVDRSGDVVIELAGQGTDMVHSQISYTLGDNVENLYLTGRGSLDGTGNDLVNRLTGNGSANVLDGKGGADTMKGGNGDDIYVVDNTGDKIIEKAGQGDDAVHSAVTYYLPDNVEDLVLTGTAAINGVGNAQDNRIDGNDASNTLWGRGGSDVLTGNGDHDLFLFAAGDADGDQITDFSGNGAEVGDYLYFLGYGSLAAGAALARLDATHWRISSADGAVHETIVLSNGADVYATDYVFA